MDILLIGMPGCGKTTIGTLLAEALHKPFADLDALVEEQEQSAIPDIFAKRGEEGFRDCETKVLERAVGGNRVLATGGGIIKRPKNVELMRRSGIVVFIDRPLEQIVGDVDTQSRPLLAEGRERLYGLYQERYPLYCQAAHVRVVNDKSAQEAVKAILEHQSIIRGENQ